MEIGKIKNFLIRILIIFLLKVGLLILMIQLR